MSFVGNIAEIPDSEEEPLSSSPTETNSNVLSPPRAVIPPTDGPGTPPSQKEWVIIEQEQEQKMPEHVLDSLENDIHTDPQLIDHSQHEKTPGDEATAQVSSFPLEPGAIKAPEDALQSTSTVAEENSLCNQRHLQEMVSGGRRDASLEATAPNPPECSTGSAGGEVQNLEQDDQSSATVDPPNAFQASNPVNDAEDDWQPDASVYAKQLADHYDGEIPVVAETENQPEIDDVQENGDTYQPEHKPNDVVEMVTAEASEQSMPGESDATKDPLTGSTSTTESGSTKTPSEPLAQLSAPEIVATNAPRDQMELDVATSPALSAPPQQGFSVVVRDAPHAPIAQENDQAKSEAPPPIQPPQGTLAAHRKPLSPAKSPRKTSQEATVAELRAQRRALIAALVAIPSIQELIVENNDNDASSTASAPADSGPSDVDVMTAANQVVKKHIKLLHEYNEIKDVGQGLMGLIADQRGVRIVEVQDEFGIGEKD